MKALLVAIAATLFIPSSTLAQGRPPADPCFPPGSPASPRLLPVDEASRRADFVEFRRRLQDAVARKDESAVLAVVDPGVRIDFGDSGGTKGFKTQIIESRNEDFWSEFATILRLGGRFRTNDAFDAPYTFSAWPENVDSFECMAVVGTRVRLRASPRLDATVVTHLDYAIVRVAPGEAETLGWKGVQLSDGRAGYVSSRYLRSPIARRALFQFHDGRWWLMAYVAGD